MFFPALRPLVFRLMAQLVFSEDDHRYVVDGEEVPSVSQLTRFLEREVYQDTPQHMMDMAANRGTKIHKATEALDKFGSVEIDDDLAPYLKAYVDFSKAVKHEWEKIEWSVNNGSIYAGTLDRYGTMNDIPVIVDIKSTQNITALHKVLYTAQLNLYRLAAIKAGKQVEGLWVLQLKKDGKYRLLQLEINEPLAQACITMHEAIKNSKRVRKKKDD